MVQEIGETRDQMSRDLIEKVTKLVEDKKEDKEPFYIIYHAKPHRSQPNTIVSSLKMCRKPPINILGILVWYVDNSNGIFEFREDLSSPPDVPTNPALLSTNPKDMFPSVAKRGQILQVVH